MNKKYSQCVNFLLKAMRESQERENRAMEAELKARKEAKGEAYEPPDEKGRRPRSQYFGECEKGYMGGDEREARAQNSARQAAPVVRWTRHVTVSTWFEQVRNISEPELMHSKASVSLLRAAAKLNAELMKQVRKAIADIPGTTSTGK